MWRSLIRILKNFNGDVIIKKANLSNDNDCKIKTKQKNTILFIEKLFFDLTL